MVKVGGTGVVIGGRKGKRGQLMPGSKEVWMAEQTGEERMVTSADPGGEDKVHTAPWVVKRRQKRE